MILVEDKLRIAGYVCHPLTCIVAFNMTLNYGNGLIANCSSTPLAGIVLYWRRGADTPYNTHHHRGPPHTSEPLLATLLYLQLRIANKQNTHSNTGSTSHWVEAG